MKRQQQGFFWRAGPGGLLLLALVNGSARAGMNGANIRLSGTVVALSCTVEPQDINKPVSLGRWTRQQFAVPSGHSQPVDFAIRLTGCAGGGVTLAFTGAQNGADRTLLALNDSSTASGLAVEILDAAHHRLAMGEQTPRVEFDSQGNASLDFSARYVTVATPTAGTANADSEFTLTYD